MTRARRWEREEAPPRRPYRDTALLHLGLAGVIVVVALLTGGGLQRALVVAVVFFVLATGWSWWRWRQRLAEARRRVP